MYRTERFDVLFNVQISHEMRAALHAGALEAGTRDSDFARMVIDLGLAAWRAKQAPNTRRSGGD